MNSPAGQHVSTPSDDERARRQADIERKIFGLARQWDRVRPLYKPYVDGVEDLPDDGRFLLVANHSFTPSSEILLLLYEVQRHLGRRVRALTDRRFGTASGWAADFIAAGGGIVGTPEGTAQLMRANEPILVFPGGTREIGKGKDQVNKLLWGNRAGFARLAIEHNYPIVTAAVVGGDDWYKILTSSDGTWAQINKKVSKWLGSDTEVTLPLARGIGPTLLPRPQRLYVRFSQAIDTTRPKGSPADEWLTTVRDTARTELESDLADLLAIRETDPFRNLAPWAWRSAVMPKAHTSSGNS
jgi:1-acyl-sn-glycerol-3-phosphate acyltransferase